MTEGRDQPEARPEAQPAAQQVPASVSFRQLQAWLEQATPDSLPGGSHDAAGAPAAFEMLMAEWMRSSQALLRSLRQEPAAVSQGRSPRQLMALGALQAHLAMALQAATASSGRQPE